MAKNSVSDWDTTAAGNTDVGGIGIQGTNAVLNFDNAVREIMAQVKTEFDEVNTFVTDATDAVAIPTIQRLRDLPIPVTEFADSALKTAIADGTITDSEDEECTDAMQKAFDYVRDSGRGEIDMRPGTYIHRTLLLPTKTALRGQPGRTILKVSQDQPDTGGSIIRMDSMDGSVAEYDQTDVTFENIIFDGGSRTMTSPVALVRALSIDRLTIQRCQFLNQFYQFLTTGGCREVNILQNRFVNWGRQEDAWTVYTGNSSGTPAFEEGGAAIVIGRNPLDDDKYALIGSVSGNLFQTGEWSAAYIFSQYVDFTDNLIIDAKEAALFTTNRDAGPDSALGQYGRSIVARNKIINTKQKYIQGAGMEIGLKNAIVTDNYIEGSDGAGLDFKGDCENVLARNNLLLNNCRNEFEWDLFGSDWGQLVVRNLTSPAPEIAPIDLTVQDNKITDTDSPKVAPYAISLYNSGSAAKVSRLVVTDNDVREGFLTGAIRVDAGLVSGTDYVLQDNRGAEGTYSPSLTWTPTVGSTAGSTGVFTVNSARYRRQGAEVFYQIQITITSLGDATGNLQFSLPTAAAFAGSGTGFNPSGGYGLGVQFSAGSTVNVSRSSNGVFPGATGNILRISGSYLEA